MELIKENLIKKRSVYKTDNFIRKYWHDKTLNWATQHYHLVKQFAPELVIEVGQDCSGVYMDMNIVKGSLATSFEYTDEFVKKIYKFCLKNIEETKPFAHGDWTLSNMIIDGENIVLIDWDNVGIYPKSTIMRKLRSDMIATFGDRFLEVMNDSTGV
jgi:thiamine kinase-like enzyme